MHALPACRSLPIGSNVAGPRRIGRGAFARDPEDGTGPSEESRLREIHVVANFWDSEDCVDVEPL